MPMYVRRTRAIQMGDLASHVREELAAHADARQINLADVRMWHTHSENPPATSGLGRLLRRRSNATDPDAEHDTVVVLHPTHVIIAVDGVKRGTSVLSVLLTQASVVAGLGVDLGPVTADAGGFTITGIEGDRPGSFYVGMGTEPAAGECFTAVRSAITHAKNSARK